MIGGLSLSILLAMHGLTLAAQTVIALLQGHAIRGQYHRMIITRGTGRGPTQGRHHHAMHAEEGPIQGLLVMMCQSTEKGLTRGARLGAAAAAAAQKIIREM